jgi:hypothetical protein
VDDFQSQFSQLETELDDMIFTYEILPPSQDEEGEEGEDEEEGVSIKLWETYKIHPDLMEVKILEFGGWNKSHGLNSPSIVSDLSKKPWL